jgi:hypothetical protein
VVVESVVVEVLVSVVSVVVAVSVELDVVSVEVSSQTKAPPLDTPLAAHPARPSRTNTMQKASWRI